MPPELERSFLLTDVEGSTPLWDRDPVAMAEAAARHDAIVAELVSRHGGHLVKTKGEGDSTFSVFESPLDAVTAAVRLQQELAAAEWPTEQPLRVRAAVHTGTAQERDGDWYGVTVIRAARLRSLGVGGQVLLSGATAAAVAGRLPGGCRLVDLGEVALRGLEVAEHAWELMGPGLVQAGKASSSDGVSARLPKPNRLLVGRDDDQSAVAGLLGGGERLVSLVGPGGVGKTSLAVAVAHRVNDAFADGAVFVAAQELADTSQLAGAVATAVGAPSASLLAAHLRSRRMLIVLDNLEHLDRPGDWVGELLTACPGVAVLATSRQRLGGHDEVVRPVTPLDVETEAVDLLLTLVRRARPSFELTAEGRAAAARLATALDGLPLALELAAAATRALSLEDVERRLGDRLDVLRSTDPSRDPRHTTLQATIAWSWKLLDDKAQAVLSAAALFPAGAPLGALMELAPAADMDDDELLQALESLVDHSLVAVDDTLGTARYRVLETVRRFAADALHGDDTALARRLHTAMVRWAQQVVRPPAESGGEALDRWAARCAREQPNVYAAAAWALSSDGDPWEGGVLVEACLPWWRARGGDDEAIAWCEQAADHELAPPVPRALLRHSAAHFRFGQGDVAGAADQFRRGIIEIDDAGDELTTALRGARAGLWYGLGQTQPPDESAASYQAAQADARAAGDHGLDAMVLNNRAVVARQLGRFEECEALAAEGLAVARQHGEGAAESVLLGNLATCRLSDAGPAEALELSDQAVERAQAAGHADWIVIQLVRRCELHRRLGLLRDAHDDAAEAARVAAKRYGRLAPAALAALSAVRFDAGDREIAGRLLDRAAELAGDEESRLSVAMERGRQLLVAGDHDGAAEALAAAVAAAGDSLWNALERAVAGAHLACARARAGSLAGARQAIREAWVDAGRSFDRHAMALVVEASAVVLALRGDDRLAAQALGAAAATGDPSRLALAPAALDLPVELRARLGDGPYASLVDEGRTIGAPAVLPELVAPTGSPASLT